MLNLKKTAVAVLALGSSAVFAGTMGPVCTPGNVTVPCEMQAWDFGAKALYLQPSFNDTAGNYLGTASSDGNSSLLDGTPDWGWGFMIEGSYHFSTGNDVNINWYHLNDNAQNSTFGSETFLNSVLTPSPATVQERVSINPQWDAVNFEFGQHVDFGMLKNIRFHGGGQYAFIKNTTTFNGANVAGENYNQTNESRFSGFGVRFGADMSYDIGNGLMVFANGAGAVLSGTSKIDASSTNNITGQTNASQSLSGSRTAIVPEVEGKLGAAYKYSMPQGDVTFDVGYMWVNYFNALSFNTTGATATIVDDSDFGVQGVFFGLKWVGNVV